ncbi:hypothetical protein HMPREF0636_0878 [Porphyromonas catoniae ATCC 51270]|uniref:Uncharacterized protein n=1 Tax=Porphyromonas catoniae ATCC 51270 TaxID=887901 RepID=Z4WS35_9PORP|nr:hypothetical protein HMPREF0636_0878 [Porphyromonas catoniae ATCC 51270]
MITFILPENFLDQLYCLIVQTRSFLLLPSLCEAPTSFSK